MARFRCGLALVGALVLLAACSTSSEPSQLNLAKAERAIRGLADKAYRAEADVGPVRCPSKVRIQKNLVFTCTVDIDGVPLGIRVRQQDKKGNVRIDQSQALMFTKKMEDFVAQYSGQHGAPTSGVTCGTAKVLVRTPGAKVTCTIDFADGTHGTAVVGVKNTDAQVALLSIKPSKG
jgi:Domain of unknown function (DUF4333)